MDQASPHELLDAFRGHYFRLETSVSEAVGPGFGDSVVLERLGDDLDQYFTSFQTVSNTLLTPILPWGLSLIES